MRTTVRIDDDVLAAATAIAHHQNRSLGDVLSDLARGGLHRRKPSKTRNGIPLLPREADGPPVTLDIVNALRDELP